MIRRLMGGLLPHGLFWFSVFTILRFFLWGFFSFSAYFLLYFHSPSIPTQLPPFYPLIGPTILHHPSSPQGLYPFLTSLNSRTDHHVTPLRTPWDTLCLSCFVELVPNMEPWLNPRVGLLCACFCVAELGW